MILRHGDSFAVITNKTAEAAEVYRSRRSTKHSFLQCFEYLLVRDKSAKEKPRRSEALMWAYLALL